MCSRTVGNLVDILNAKICFVDNSSGFLNGEIRAVPFSIEPFFGGASDDFSVDDDNRGGIVALEILIFPLFEAGPMSLFECNRVFKSTNAEDFCHLGHFLCAQEIE